MNMQPRAQPLSLAPSFGFGDRIGKATAGHIAAMRHSGSEILPIFPQQSIREMTRTNRTPRQVMDDAVRDMIHSGWTSLFGADADHLKTAADVDITAEAGFCFFTIDPSGFVDAHADNYDEPTLRAKFAALGARVDWIREYFGRTVPLPSGTCVACDEVTCLRAAVKYGLAVNHALSLSRHIEAWHAARHRDFEIELSIDETPQPTTLAEHWIIADRCLRNGMRLVSLAPRFIGDFEKGVDYKGNIAEFERSVGDHAAIARAVGPYKLSLHSGSDKISIYTPFARATKGLFHVKTAGTSYLEALRVVARHNEPFFRRIIDFSRSRFDTDRATYHLSATLDTIPSPHQIVSARELERIYLEHWDEVPAGRGFVAPGRQILHCTFGSVLTHPEFAPELLDTVDRHRDTYVEVLAEHFARHLTALREGMRISC
jgi:hypothetical protein